MAAFQQLILSHANSTQWSNIESTAKSSIQEKKIRVLFLAADGTGSSGAAGVAGMTNGASHDDEPPAYSSPSPAAVTPQRGSTAPPEKARDSSALDSTPSNSSSNQQQTTMGAIAAAIPTSSEDLKAQLTDAKATISRLRQQAEEQGLRQRKSDAVNQDSKERITTGTTGLGVQNTPAGGVPVQVVAGLCLLCFLIAYFFF